MRSLIIFAAIVGLLFLADPVSAISDSDGDNWNDTFEGYLTTDPNDNCGGGGVNPTWPPDFQYSNFIDTGDMAVLNFWFGMPVGNGAGKAPFRFDIDHPTPSTTQGSGFIDTADMAEVTNRFGWGCTP